MKCLVEMVYSKKMQVFRSRIRLLLTLYFCILAHSPAGFKEPIWLKDFLVAMLEN